MALCTKLHSSDIGAFGSGIKGNVNFAYDSNFEAYIDLPDQIADVHFLRSHFRRASLPRAGGSARIHSKSSFDTPWQFAAIRAHYKIIGQFALVASSRRAPYKRSADHKIQLPRPNDTNRTRLIYRKRCGWLKKKEKKTTKKKIRV